MAPSPAAPSSSAAAPPPPPPLPFPPEVIAYQLAHPDDYNAGPLLALCIAGICIVVPAVGLRLWSRKMQKIPLLADDWTLVAATILSCLAVLMFLMKGYHYGFGHHYFTLSPHTMYMFGLYDYPFNILYTTGYPLSRISLVLLYRRVFDSRNWFRITAWVLIAMYSGYMIGTVVADAVTTIPIAAYWDHTIVPTRAIDTVTLYEFNTAFNIATDVVLLIIPNLIIWKLRMTMWSKIGLTGIFALGVLTLFASIMRLKLFFDVKAYDVSYTLVPCATWTAVELFLGILCPCLVTMGPLVTMSFHFLSSYASSFLSRGSSSRRSRGHSHIKEVRGGDNGIDSVERDVRQWGGGGKHHDEVNNEMVTVNVNAEEKEMDGLKMNGVQNPRHYLD